MTVPIETKLYEEDGQPSMRLASSRARHKQNKRVSSGGKAEIHMFCPFFLFLKDEAVLVSLPLLFLSLLLPSLGIWRLPKHHAPYMALLMMNELHRESRVLHFSWFSQ